MAGNQEMTHQVIWSDAVRPALGWSIAKRSILVAIVVGSILNLVNQGDALFSGGTVSFWKLGLTYCVPFCVATYGAICTMISADHPEMR